MMRLGDGSFIGSFIKMEEWAQDRILWQHTGTISSAHVLYAGMVELRERKSLPPKSLQLPERRHARRHSTPAFPCDAGPLAYVDHCIVVLGKFG